MFWVAVCCFVAMTADAQSADTLLKKQETARHRETNSYQKHPTLPVFNILLTDNVTIFNTKNIPAGRATAIMLFDPQCPHCRKFTKKLVNGMDSVEDIDFYLVTAVHNMADVRTFAEDFQLSRYKNIKVLGRDNELFLFDYYGVELVPTIALYDKDKNFIKLFEANATVKALYKYTH